MIFGKFIRAIKAQINKLANFFRGRDPIAEMQLECDQAAEQMKDGRRGLEQYRGLVERVARQVADNRRSATDLEAKVRSYLASGDRVTAGRFALELQRVEAQVAENSAQLRLHETAYENNLVKLKHANRRVGEIREKIAGYDATLRMSKAEAEIAKLAQSLRFDVSTDFGQVERIIQEQIDESRAQVRVAADLSGAGLEEVREVEAAEAARAELALSRFGEAAKNIEDKG